MPEPDNTDESSGHKVVGLIGKVIGAAAAFVSLVVALTKDRPAAAVASTFLIFVGLIVGSYYVRVARKAEGRRRFQRSGTILVGTWIVLAVALATVFSVGPARHAAIYDVLGFKRRAEVKISAIHVWSGAKGFEVVATVDNGMPVKHLVTSVGLSVATDQRIGCLASPYQYRVRPVLRVSQHKPGVLTAKSEVTEPSRPGVHETAIGSVSGLCGAQTVNLLFGTDVRLPPHEYSDMTIALPEEFKVTRDESPPSRLRRANASRVAGVSFPTDDQSARQNSEPASAGRVVLELTIDGQTRSVRACHATSVPGFSESRDACPGGVPEA